MNTGNEYFTAAEINKVRFLMRFIWRMASEEKYQAEYTVRPPEYADSALEDGIDEILIGGETHAYGDYIINKHVRRLTSGQLQAQYYVGVAVHHRPFGEAGWTDYHHDHIAYDSIEDVVQEIATHLFEKRVKEQIEDLSTTWAARYSRYTDEDWNANPII